MTPSVNGDTRGQGGTPISPQGKEERVGSVRKLPDERAGRRGS